jgi:hypothetical protein
MCFDVGSYWPSHRIVARKPAGHVNRLDRQL